MEKLMPHSFGEIKDGVRNTRLTSPERLLHSNELRPQRDGSRELTTDSKPSQLRGTNAAQVTPLKSELPAPSKSVQALPSKRTAERAITSANPKPPQPKLQAGPNESALGNTEKASFLAASPRSNVNPRTSVISDTKRAPSRPVPQSRVEEIPGLGHRNDVPRALSAKRSEGGSQQANPSAHTDRSRPIAEKLEEAATTRRDTGSHPGSPTPRTFPDPWPIMTVRERSLQTEEFMAAVTQATDTYTEDRWPELPDTPAALSHEFAPELYRDHTRALDLEQRGGS
jgi:hypothetical protein